MDANNVGKFDLTIDKFETKKNGEESILSPHFYSHLNGYKVRLLVYPGGRGNAKGTHLSAYFTICIGENDDTLAWPCKYAFDVGIVNQKTGSTHGICTFSYDTETADYQHAFNKPSTGDNIALGETEIISHTDLKANIDLTTNDNVIVRCTARSPV